MEQSDMFYTFIRELIKSYNVDRLMDCKMQIEADMKKISDDERLIERYEFVCKAIEQVQGKRSA